MATSDTMQYESWEIELCRQGSMLAACCRDLSGDAGNWHSPLCETARKLWWYVDRYFLWERELFPARRCPERDRFREAFMEMAQRLEVTP